MHILDGSRWFTFCTTVGYLSTPQPIVILRALGLPNDHCCLCWLKLEPKPFQSFAKFCEIISVDRPKTTLAVLNLRKKSQIRNMGQEFRETPEKTTAPS